MRMFGEVGVGKYEGDQFMKYSILLAATAVLALSACKKSEETAADATATPAASEAATPAASEAAATTPAAGAGAFTADEAPSKEFMVGTWGEGDACEMPITFLADGKTKDGPFDKWEVKDGSLVVDGEAVMKLKVIDADHMESSNNSSSKVHKLKRC